MDSDAMEVRPERRAEPEPRPTVDDDTGRRIAARRFYRAAPPYLIEFEDNGTVALKRKTYEYWDTHDPEDATTWITISTHDDLEEAERRLRLICGPSIYYDADGKPMKAPRKAKPRWPSAPADDD
jgi:hypothetical protein